MSFTSCSSRICGKINSILVFTFYENTQFIDIIRCIFGCHSQNISSWALGDYMGQIMLKGTDGDILNHVVIM